MKLPIMKSSKIQLQKNRDLLKQCGVVMKHVSSKLRKIQRPRQDAFRLNRRRFPMYAYAVENLQSIWFTGVKRINV